MKTKRETEEGESRDEWPRKGDSNPRKPKADVDSTIAREGARWKDGQQV